MNVPSTAGSARPHERARLSGAASSLALDRGHPRCSTPSPGPGPPSTPCLGCAMSERHEQDLYLIGRVAGGDREAFAHLFDRLAPAVLGLLVRILGRGGEAEEVLQEVFLQVWEEADRYQPGRSSPLGWVLMLARSRGIERLRSRQASQRRAQTVARDGLWSDGAANPRGSDRLEAEERRQQLLAALGVLSSEQRQCIELAFFQGLTHSQIAECTAAPLGTVKSRILLGMNKLRQALAPYR